MRVSAADVDHRTRWLQESGLADMMARLFAVDRLHDVVRQRLIVLAGAHPSVQIVFHLRKEAGSDFAV